MDGKHNSINNLFTRPLSCRPSFQQILADLQRMASKLSMAGCDSASSLPMQQTCAQPQPPLQQQGSAAAANAGGIAGVGIDPAKLHNWEPQTSLLDLRTNSSVQGSLGPAMSAAVVSNASNNSQHMGPHDSMSWGMQSAGGGLWLGGEFAPSNMPSDVQLPTVHHGDEPVPAMPGLHEALAAAAAAQYQQQQLQIMQQQRVQAAQQGGNNLVQWPGLAGPAAALQQQQQHGQVWLQVQPEERSSTDPDAVPNSLSSSGVYLDGSSTVEEGYYDSGVYGSLPAAQAAAAAGGASTYSRPLAQPSSNMATIEEETEQPAAGTAATAAAAAAGASAVAGAGLKGGAVGGAGKS
jgi:hypothetical protein